MSERLYPAVVAVLIGVVIGVLLFVPFVAVQYRRAGRLTLGRTVLAAAFLVYGLALWTYTLLPMPDPTAVRCTVPQLQPFRFVADTLEYPLASLGDLLRNPAFMQLALNVVLFLPLGFLLRLVWRRGILVTTLVGLATSLAIETTQLSGVWGLYPCAYRLFDVDDLLANTAGALLGGLASLPLRPWLARHDGHAAPAPRRVTFGRRLLGMLCDALTVGLLSATAGIGVNAWRLLVLGEPASATDDGVAGLVGTLSAFVLTAIVALASGRTLGDLAVLIRWEGGRLPTPIARILRFLAGVGVWQLLLGFVSPLGAAFALASLVVLIAARSYGGLPGLVSRQRPVDARAGSGTAARRADEA